MKKNKLFRSLNLLGGIMMMAGLMACAGTSAAKLSPKKLTGEELYAINCSRCHNERYATEKTDGQWRTAMLHMRIRAGLPVDDARKILKYLQDNN